jgi:DNA polymerase-3 subunit delta'
MEHALRAAAPDANDGEIAEMVAAGEGSPGVALDRRGLGLAAIDDDLARLSTHGDPTNQVRSALASKLALKAAQPRYELFLGRVPRHIAGVARSRTGAPLGEAIRIWEKARDLAGSAVPLSLDRRP